MVGAGAGERGLPGLRALVALRLSGTMTLRAGCVEEFCSAEQRVGTCSGKDEGKECGELPGCPAPPPAARSAGPGPPPWSRGLLAMLPLWQRAAAQALLFPCSFPAFPPLQGGLSSEDSLASPGQQRCPLPPPCPAPGRWGHTCPLPGLAQSQDYSSVLAVVVEGCVLAECLGNGARPHLRHAHPMATAEPARRHDGGWHLCIFSFCCIALRAGNEGCGHPVTRIQQPMLCTPPVGIAAAGEGGSTAC